MATEDTEPKASARPPLPEIERIVTAALRRYRRHPEYDDLRQEALLAAWDGVGRYHGRARWTTIAYKAAVWAVTAYLRTRRCHPDHYRRAGSRDIRWLPLDALPDGYLRQPDPAPGITRRLAQAALLRAAEAACTPAQWAALRATALEGLTEREAAHSLGISRSTLAVHLRRAREKLRSALAAVIADEV